MTKTSKMIERPAGSSVYCGPTIPGVAKQFTVYTGGIPVQLKKAIEKNPVLGSLVVALGNLPEVMGQLRQGAGTYFVLYRKAQEIH